MKKQNENKLKFIELNKDKSPKGKFSPTNKNIDELENVGLLLNNKVVVIDFDGDNTNEKNIMDYFEENFPTLIIETDKGKHFYYSKPNNTNIKSIADKITIGGFQCDYKTGHQYTMIKRNGVFRKTNQELTLDNLPELPLLMYPLNNTRNFSTVNMSGFIQHDGRNSALFNHLFLVRLRYGDENIENIANFINDNIFDERLENKELSSIVSSVLNYEIETSNDKESWMDVAEGIIKDLQCIWFENDIMFFDESINYYSRELKKIEHHIQNKYRNSKNYTLTGIKEVLKQMACILSNNKTIYTRDDTYILCGKQLVNTKKDEIIENTRTIVTDVRYNHSIMSNNELQQYENDKKIGWKFLDDISCSNEEVKQVICECLGCMLAPTNHFGKIFIWYGSGANGKSVLVKVMKAIMGDLLTNANILNVNERFSLSRAYKGVANVTDDVGITTIKETGILKSLVDGSSIEIDRKHLDPIDWVPNSQFVMCCNDLPRIQDTTKGMIRRLSFIPFDMELKEEKIDYDLTDKLLGKSEKLDISEQNDNALRYIMTKAIIAYRKARSRNRLTELEIQTQLLSDFKEENKDSITSFYEYLIEREKGKNGLCDWIDGKTYIDIFHEYENFADFDTKITQRKFLVQFNRKLPERIKKKKVTINGITYDTYELDT